VTKEIEGGPFEISEDDIAANQGRVRALLIQRYEQLYGRVKVRVDEDERQAEGSRPMDPRFLELGVRILKEISGLYRLGRQVVLPEDEPDPEVAAVDRRTLVEAQLTELESKRAATEKKL
jgi:hypothetical protein